MKHQYNEESNRWEDPHPPEYYKAHEKVKRRYSIIKIVALLFSPVMFFAILIGGDLFTTDGGNGFVAFLFVMSGAVTLCQVIYLPIENAHKIIDFFKSIIERPLREKGYEYDE